jgi:hypothetical protein
MLFKLLSVLLVAQTQADAETLTGVHIKGSEAKLSIGGCDIQLDGDKLKTSCPIDMPTTTAGPTTTNQAGNPGIGDFDALHLSGPDYTHPDDTESVVLGQVTMKAQYEVEWEIKWFEDNDPPTIEGAYPQFVHFGNSDSIRAPALWLNSDVTQFYYAPDQGSTGRTHHPYFPNGVGFEAGQESKFSMTMKNAAGTGNTDCTAVLSWTPLATGVTYELASESYPNCNQQTGTQNVYVNDPWYTSAHHSTRNLRYRFWD